MTFQIRAGLASSNNSDYSELTGERCPPVLSSVGAPLGGHDEGSIPVFARWFGSWQISLRRRTMSRSELIRNYDRASRGWNRTLDRFGVPDAYETLLRKALSDSFVADIGEGFRVLDCGIGTGALSRALSHALPHSFRLDAVDISPRMLERADENLRDRNLSVILRDCDVRDLPYQDGTFDLVMSAHMLEHFVDPMVALREMVRVLKPGGFLIVCLTSRSPMGAYVHLRWRTHRVTTAQAESWLTETGLEEAYCLKFDKHAFCRQLSIACIGRKPSNDGHTTTCVAAPIGRSGK